MSRVRPGATLVTVALVLAACANDTASLPSEPPVEPLTTVTLTSPTLAPTTAPTTSTPAPTTTPSTPVVSTAPTTTASAPPTSLTNADDATAIALVASFYDTYRNCTADYVACNADSFPQIVDAVYAERLRDEVNAARAEHRSTSNLDSFRGTFISIRDGGPSRKIVQVCHQDGVVVHLRPPGAEPVLVSDRYVSGVEDWYVDMTADGWRITGSVAVSESIGQENDQCA